MANTIRKFLDLYHNKTLEEVPFNEGDIILAGIISYCDFEGHRKYVKKKMKDGLVQFNEFHTERDAVILSRKNLIPKSYEALLKKLFESKRYKYLRIGYMEDYFDEEEDTQFFAMSIITKSYAIISFRGTDISLVGWKEDFDLASKSKIPSHELAKKYVKRISTLTDKPIIIVGHSKGGNLAYYSFLKSSQSVKNRVYKVYNLDGPSFWNLDINYDEYKEKLVKIVPSSSIFGLLLEKTNNFQIIKSSKKNVNAHDLLTWEFDPKNKYLTLMKASSLSKYSLALQISINNWFNKYKKNDFKSMGEFIYKVAISNKQGTVLGLKLDIIKKRKIYLNAIEQYNPKKKTRLIEMSRDFVKIYFSVLFHIKNYDIATLEMKEKKEIKENKDNKNTKKETKKRIWQKNIS